MNWLDFWNQRGKETTEFAQVARVVDGKTTDTEILNKIAQRIREQLELGPEDHLLDVCCGNGALTQLLLPYCRSIQGVDFSETLIERANALAIPNLQFTCAPAEAFAFTEHFEKILLYFSFQYFESYDQGRKVIQNLVNHSKPGTKILIGDIPNQQRILSYYNSPERIWNYIKQSLRNRNDMGRFWHPVEMKRLCSELGVNVEFISQLAWQPYSHYRFDWLITV